MSESLVSKSYFNYFMWFKKNRSLLIVALVALVNMLGYGIIIPVLYAYSKKFGMTDFQNGLLFASYSVCQFISTPIIGRLSDKYGRRPLLIVSILGTALSFFIMAFAPSVGFLFLARMLDGLTAGNVPVVFAVVSDTTKPQDRPRAFGLIGSAFNFGFVFGPAVAALTLGFGDGVPFIIAGAISLFAAILALFYLPETNVFSKEVVNAKLFDFRKMWHTLFDPNVGITFIISLIFFLAFSCALIYGFQPFTMNVLKITESQNAQLFTLFGVVGLLSQNLLVDRVSKSFGMKKALRWSIFFTAISFLLMAVSGTIWFFVLASIILGMANSVSQTLIPSILSQEVDQKSQGTMMGLNSSYQSIGMIIGPILGGAVAAMSARFPFVVGAVLIMICFSLSFRLLRPGVHKESAF